MIRRIFSLFALLFSVVAFAQQPANTLQVGGTAVSTGNGTTGAGSQRVTIASDNTAFAVNATLSAETTKVIGVVRTSDGAGNLLTTNSATYTAKFGLDSNLLGTLGTAFSTAGKVDVKAADGDVFVRQTTGSNLHVISDANSTVIIGETVPVSTATTTDTTLRCTLVSAASTNATNCKNASGNIYGFRFINTTATVYYLRTYNTSSSPTCSSATGFIESIPIPASASGAGVVMMEPFGEGYSTGISFCFTGGSSSTDNTNAAVGVFGTILYK